MDQMNVDQLATKLQKIYKPQPSTFAYWQKAIKPIAHLPLQEVSEEVVLDYRVEGLEKLSEGTLKTRIGYLKGIWNKARKWKLVKGENPWQYADDGLSHRRRNPELYPWEFYEYYHNDPYFVCLWYTGCRIGEIAGIYKENIVTDVEIPYFNLVHQSNRRLKNDESIRKIPIHPACLPFVGDLYLSKARSPGTSWSETFGKNLGLPCGDAAHSLRHSFTSRMNEAGIIERVQDALLGHAPATKTGRYGKVTLAVMQKELLKLK